MSEEEKQRHLLDSFYLMQTAVCLQEDVIADVLNVLPHHQVSHMMNHHIVSVKLYVCV